ncbi:hypothetical protein YC2023_052789 [Brassica napus]
MAVGNPTLQRMLSERRAALGLPVLDMYEPLDSYSPNTSAKQSNEYKEVVAFASSEITLVLVANLEATTCMSTEISEMVSDLPIVMGVLQKPNMGLPARAAD